MLARSCLVIALSMLTVTATFAQPPADAPFPNSDLAAEQRAAVVVSRMTLEIALSGVQVGGPVRVSQLTAPAVPQPAPAGPMGRFNGPPATMAESTLAEARTVTLPPTSLTVYRAPGAIAEEVAPPFIPLRHSSTETS